jgi:hypothetical protein
MNKKKIDSLEKFFSFVATIAMPFIAISNYFSFTERDKRGEPLAILFLISTLSFALFYTYFSWKTWKKMNK